MTAIAFESVSKKFRRGECHDSLRDLVPSLGRRLLGLTAPAPAERDFWALRDVSFSVASGEALGIIGPNGAGKSTTLKLLTKILRPTTGQCHVRGRVGALIEVAAGFHPDLTGRENVFLQGAIMGMKRPDVIGKLDAIVAFAGVSDFIDTPVKRYSSGMNARLGFSIAAHLDPDVLIIDEVLSVGDMAFQERCLQRMSDFRRQGVTIVFVSHNLQAVSSLCPTALFLQGDVRAYGPTSETILHYIRDTSIAGTSAVESDVDIRDARLSRRGAATERVMPGDRLTLNVTYVPRVTVTDIELGFLVYRSTDGLLVHGQGIPADRLGIRQLTAGSPLRVEFLFNAHLTRGHYHIECHVFHKATQQYLGRVRPAALFQVEEHTSWGGVADLELVGRIVDSPGIELHSANLETTFQ